MILVLSAARRGQGTQAKLLAAESDPAISTGDMLRDHKARRLGKQASRSWTRRARPRRRRIALVEERLAARTRRRVHPRRLPRPPPRPSPRASSSKGRHHAVLSYEVAEEVLVERQRPASCPKCGALPRLRQRRRGACDRDDAGSSSGRRQAGERQERMAEYTAKTEPLKRFYARGALSEVEGVGTPEGILADQAASRRSLGLEREMDARARRSITRPPTRSRASARRASSWRRARRVGARAAVPGVSTWELDRARATRGARAGRRAGVPRLPRLPGGRSACRSTRRSSTASRRRTSCSRRATSSASTSAWCSRTAGSATRRAPSRSAR